MLLRLLFPSWAFFDTVTDVPVLEARLHDGANAGSWRAVLQAPPRSVVGVLFNPEGTTHLALQSAVDRLAVECEHGDVDAVTRDIVAAIAGGAVHEWGESGDTYTHWSWRVIAIAGGNRSAPLRVLYECGPVPHGA